MMKVLTNVNIRNRI